MQCTLLYPNYRYLIYELETPKLHTTRPWIGINCTYSCPVTFYSKISCNLYMLTKEWCVSKVCQLLWGNSQYYLEQNSGVPCCLHILVCGYMDSITLFLTKIFQYSWYILSFILIHPLLACKLPSEEFRPVKLCGINFVLICLHIRGCYSWHM
jgi:hypothetical protein